MAAGPFLMAWGPAFPAGGRLTAPDTAALEGWVRLLTGTPVIAAARAASVPGHVHARIGGLASTTPFEQPPFFPLHQIPSALQPKGASAPTLSSSRPSSERSGRACCRAASLCMWQVRSPARDEGGPAQGLLLACQAQHGPEPTPREPPPPFPPIMRTHFDHGPPTHRCDDRVPDHHRRHAGGSGAKLGRRAAHPPQPPRRRLVPVPSVCGACMAGGRRQPAEPSRVWL